MSNIKYMTKNDITNPEFVRWYHDVIENFGCYKETLDELVSQYIENPHANVVTYGYFIDGIARGMICVWYMDDTQDYHISNVYVDAAYRSRGIATALLKYIQSHFKRYPLQLVAELRNQKAILLYQSLGFKIEYVYEAHGTNVLMSYKSA